MIGFKRENYNHTWGGLAPVLQLHPRFKQNLSPIDTPSPLSVHNITFFFHHLPCNPRDSLKKENFSAQCTNRQRMFESSEPICNPCLLTASLLHILSKISRGY